MAKIHKTGNTRILHGGKRRMGVQVNVEPIRTGFRACARVASKIRLDSWNAPKGYYPCAVGKNPRKAVAAALRTLAKQVGKRSGAFAGVSGAFAGVGLGGAKERRAARIIRSAKRHKNFVQLGRKK